MADDERILSVLLALNFARTTLRVERSMLGVARMALSPARTVLQIDNLALRAARPVLRVDRRSLSFGRNTLRLLPNRFGAVRTALCLLRALLRVERATPGLARHVPDGRKSTVDSARTTPQDSGHFMNRDQFNRIEMGNTVSAYMDRNKSIFSATKAMNDTVADVNSALSRIAEKIGKQRAPTAGAALDKAQVRLSFEEKILEVADQLSALAEKNKNANLAAQVEMTPSSLDKLADDDLETTGKRVSGLAVTNLAALADYGITQADVTALDSVTTQFHNVKSAPRTAIAGRAGETDTLPEELGGLTSLLRNRLDKQMTRFKKSHPEFYAGYRSARVIVDRGGSGGTDKPAPTPPPGPQ